MTDAAGELITELRALAGVGDVDEFLIDQARHPFRVCYTSGSSSGLAFAAAYDAVARPDHEAVVDDRGARGYRRPPRGTLVAVRPLAITLRREVGSDADAKRDGINVEHQTGDEAFDRVIYVSTPTTDPEILAAVLGPKVREGVLALLQLGFLHVLIDDEGSVVAYLNEFAHRTARPGRGARAVDAFALVLSDLPAISASGRAHPRPPVWSRGALLIAGVALGVILLPTSCHVAEANHCIEYRKAGDGDLSESFRDGCGTPALVALVVALVVATGAAVLARVLATPRLRGRTDSDTRILYVRAAAFLVVLCCTYVAASSLGFASLHR